MMATNPTLRTRTAQRLDGTWRALWQHSAGRPSAAVRVDVRQEARFASEEEAAIAAERTVLGLPFTLVRAERDQ